MDKGTDFCFCRKLNEFLNDETIQKAGVLSVRQGETEKSEIRGMEYDSRKIKPGELFFALPGIHTDGAQFIKDALNRGASAIVHHGELAAHNPKAAYIQVRDPRTAMSPLADSFYDHPSRHMTIIGVTGTEGKSTTVYLIYQLLKLLGCRAGFISTVMLGDGKTEIWNPEHQTTPEAPAVHRFLAQMRDNQAEYAVIESSSHGLSKQTMRLADVIFDAGVMTNVNHEHLEFHKTWEQYRSDKAELFRALDYVSLKKGIPRFGVLNADDPSASYFSNATKQKTYSFSTRGTEADLSLLSIRSESRGNWYEVNAKPWKNKFTIQDRLPGAFNAGNVLASLLAVSALLSREPKELADLVPQLRPVRGRMSTVDQGQPFEVLVDYAHTPSSFRAVFPSLRQRLDASGGRIISLFGSAGERDTQKRGEQGAVASLYSDLIFLSDEDPRGEDGMSILEEIAADISGKTRGENLFLIPDRPAAIRKAFSLARPGDLVLLLGKGHENSIIYAHETKPYDEIREAETALSEMGYN